MMYIARVLPFDLLGLGTVVMAGIEFHSKEVTNGAIFTCAAALWFIAGAIKEMGTKP